MFGLSGTHLYPRPSFRSPLYLQQAMSQLPVTPNYVQMGRPRKPIRTIFLVVHTSQHVERSIDSVCALQHPARRSIFYLQRAARCTHGIFKKPETDCCCLWIVLLKFQAHQELVKAWTEARIELGLDFCERDVGRGQASLVRGGDPPTSGPLFWCGVPIARRPNQGARVQNLFHIHWPEHFLLVSQFIRGLKHISCRVFFEQCIHVSSAKCVNVLCVFPYVQQL